MAILIVEDDDRILEFIKKGLSAEGYIIQTATNGKQGLLMAKSNNYDLIILDLMLPDTDGRTICKSLRLERISTPILMLTALDNLEDKVEGLRIGADDYLTKPFAFDELIARIQALLRRSSGYQEQSDILEFLDLSLNRSTREVRRNNRHISLTPKEFALLEYLMQSPGHVFSRAKILDNVWGYNTDPLTNVVDVYIRNLRKKLDNNSAQSIIFTVRGFGYKIDNLPNRHN